AGAILYKELFKLGIPTLSSGYVLMDEEEKIGWNYVVNPADGSILPKPVGLPHTETKEMRSVLASWKKQEPFYERELDPQATIEHHTYIAEHSIDFPISVAEFLSVTPERLVFYAFNFKQGYLLVAGGALLSADQIEIVVRFAKVFELTYRRFLDLQKAEAQAREGQIELSLERVRARTMAMQKSDELSETSSVLFYELKNLGIETIRSGVGIFNGENDIAELWLTTESDKKIETRVIGSVHASAHPAFQKWFTIWKQKGLSFSFELKGDAVRNYYETLSPYLSLPPQQVYHSREFLNGFFFPEGSLNVITQEPLSEESSNILLRFARVFGLLYRRFLDLQKAEAQTREAEIELALERVRARTMAMQKSEELSATASVLFDQFTLLGQSMERIVICTFNEEDRTFDAWATEHGGREMDLMVKLDIHEPHVIRKMYDGWKEGKKSIVVDLQGTELEEYYQFLKRAGARVSRDVFGKRRVQAAACFSKGMLIIAGPEPQSAETLQIMERFAGVFDHTYTRFLDLKHAEAQAREAHIEASLERVRAHAMAMHNSADLSSTVNIFFKELKTLGIIPMRCGVGEINEITQTSDLVFTTADKQGELYELPGRLKHEGHPVVENIYNYWKRQEEYHPVLQGTDINAYYRVIKSQMVLPDFPDYTIHYGNYFYFKEGFFFAWAEKEFTEEAMNIFRRFTSVLSLTYKRYKDLKQAEANAREAKIETSLERVRAGTMAMYKSEDLSKVAEVVFKELDTLELGILRCGIGIINKEKRNADAWITSVSDEGKTVQVSGTESMDQHPLLQGAFDAWLNKTDFSYVLEGEDLVQYYKTSGVGKVRLPDSQLILSADEITTQYYQIAVFEAGGLFAFSANAFPEEAKIVLKRFAAVFNQSYTRFLDLQKAEAQTKEAQIEASLERVRSKAMSMQKSEDLANAVAIVFEELDKLNLGMLRCGIAILNKEKRCGQIWTTTKSDKNTVVQVSGDESMDVHPLLRGAFEVWLRQETDYSYILQGDDLNNYYKALVDEGFRLPDSQSLVAGTEGLVQYYYAATFSSGGLFAFSETEFAGEAKTVLRRFADVFNLTYTRFNDLKIAEAHALQAEEDLVKLQTEKRRAEEALAELQVTQKQLIQSEKMASLGELTAGIAHEIQNPLNFVNNFSEVSNELLDEMVEEARKGNYEEVKALVNDVKQNLEKINHHGKRADGIVKGMLQHSRSSSATKEPTDINKLTDEYLRLAYHGLRAKDKTFNASMKTDYDGSVGSINIIPQDIGRVILNLITNAFYAVTEKKRQQLPGYEPTVTVSTKKAGDKSDSYRIEVRVKDNGNGIPQKVLDKIFQPFFTTKPTGQGTGLGLSLSYDIIKAHNGELKVETKEGEGSTFIISI
ncbi:MAG TPA: ATP-binding protein, partial [Chitinophagaceae bacterium]|nr:ATP-binding protein [Chitinophagaceae bacterium]